MLILFMGVGLNSPATAPVASLSAGLFVLAFFVHLVRHWSNPEEDSIIAELRRYRYVLAVFAILSTLVAIFKAETLVIGVAGSFVLFLAASMLFLIAAGWVNHWRDLHGLVSSSRGRFRDNPRAWLSWDVIFAFLPALFVFGIIISAFAL